MKLTATLVPATADRFWTISGVCRWSAAHPVRGERAHHLGAEQVRLERLARPGRAADRRDDDLGRGQSGRERREQREARRRRVAARYGDAARAAQRVAGAGQLREAVRPRARVLAAVPARPGRGVGEAVVGTAVDHDDVVAERCGQLGGAAVRQRQEDDIVARERLRVGLGRAPGRPAAPGGAGARAEACPRCRPPSACRSPRSGGRAGAEAAHPRRSRWLRPPRSAPCA